MKFKLQLYEDALQDYNQSISLDKDKLVFLCSRARVLQKLSRFEDCLVDLNKIKEGLKNQKQ